MNISTVNELIQSLESAGELSIKERKYLELAKAYVQPTAEMIWAAKYCFTSTPGWDVFKSAYIAMLAAAPQPQNAPQNIPEIIPGWIPLSERMPEDRISVILWDAEIGEVTSGHYSHKTQTFYHCGDAIENEITHWMPPPCAPQEVKGEHQIRDEMDMGARITSHRFKV
ncbi:Eaa1 [Raoultella planticola]|uniref:Eaa1 n=2 Tax=Raoultella TaxID=160674 RepID=A0A8G2A1H4_RAOPL|nr:MULTISPECIES: DUF551 domain-containing protein [Klebsiella/Raoultella group]MDX6056284.1 DUF551 domain-containing protein [Klebsiella sp. JN_Kp126]OEG88355.1 hypothetical protein AN700_0218215 [Klebsiella michiganensis]RNN94417.1 DUF551 domain-containing protein [Raoultella planticola]SAQ02216.1 Eaa1 [Raoultella planticola]HAT1692922.1 DUF551 domain-containing protein [Raoultella planticola]